MRKEKSEQMKKLEVDDTWERFYQNLKNNGKLSSSKSTKSGD
jgi:hypothetical protein